MSATPSAFQFSCDVKGCDALVTQAATSMLEASDVLEAERWVVGWGISGAPIPVRCPNHRDVPIVYPTYWTG